MSGPEVRLGVIGAGWWATQHHLPAIAGCSQATLTALADPDSEKLGRAAAAFGSPQTFASHYELLDAGIVDGVIVATPHSTHYEIARDALDSGVHVLVEKPMALRATDAHDLVRRAEAKGLHLSVGYTFHHTKHAQVAREVIRSGRIGTLQLVSGTFSSAVKSFFAGRPEDYRDVMFDFPLTPPRADSYSDPARSGGGQAQTQVTHLMGMLLWVTGASVSKVFALMADHGLAVDLVDAATFRLNNGAIGSLTATGNLQPDQPQQQAWTYYGSNGFLVQNMIDGRLELHLHDGSRERFPDLGEDEVYPAEAPARSFADLILGRAENLAPGVSGADVVTFLEASYLSAAEERIVFLGELENAQVTS